MARSLLCWGVLTICIHGALTFNWTSGVSNGSVVSVCLGDNALLPWNYTLAANESVFDLEWYFLREDGHTSLLATLVSNNFLPAHSLSQTMEYVPTAGLRVNNTSPQHDGTYSVTVTTANGRNTQMLRLLVAVSPEVTSNQLQVRQLPDHTVPNATDGLPHVQLSCGQFQSLGNPPVAVLWRTPDSNTTVPSTSYDNGTFFLSLQNPVRDGIYSCLLGTSEAATCALRRSMKTNSSLTVDGTGARLALIEERILALEKEDKPMAGDLIRQDDIQKNLSDSMTELTETLGNWTRQSVSNISDQLREIKEEIAEAKVENSNLTKAAGDLTSRLTSVTTENAALNKSLVRLTENMTDTASRDSGLQANFAQQLDELWQRVVNMTSLSAAFQSQFQSLAEQLTNLTTANADLRQKLHQQDFVNDNVTTQVRILEQQVSTLKSNNSVLQHYVHSLEQQLANSTIRCNQLQSDITEVANDVRNLTSRCTNVYSQLDLEMEQSVNISQSISSLTVRVSAVEMDKNNITSSIRELEEENKWILASSSNVSHTVENAYNEIRNFTVIVQRALTSLDDVRHLQDAWNRTFFAHVHNMTAISYQLGLELESLKANQTSFSDQVHAVATELTRVKPRLESIGSQVGRLVTHNTEVTDKVSGLEGEVDSLKMSIQHFQSYVQQQTTEVNNLTQRLSQMSSASDQIKLQLTGLSSLEQNLRDRLQNVTSDLQNGHVNVSAQVPESSQLEKDVHILTEHTQNLSSRVADIIEQMTSHENQANLLISENVKLKGQVDNVTLSLMDIHRDLDLLSAARQNDTLQIQALVHMTSDLSRPSLSIPSPTETTLAQFQQLTDLLQRTRQLQDSIRRPASCDDVKQYDPFSGPHALYVPADSVLPVYCDQTTDTGGWTVIQRRQDEYVDFYRGWDDYQNGFGDPSGNFWLGLRNIHSLTSYGKCALWIDMADFQGNRAYVKYDHFWISDVTESYTLHVDQYSGSGGDSFSTVVSPEDNMAFSTFDNDNDVHTENCADKSLYAGGWWYSKCGRANLNGVYKHGGGTGVNGMFWYSWTNSTASLSHVEMKVKCQRT